MFKLFKVSHSGYDAGLKRQPSQHNLQHQQLDALIKRIYVEHVGRYG